MNNLIISLFVLVITTNTIAQSLEFPKEINYYTTENKPKEAEEEEDNTGGRYTVSNDFHPIGWSADGKFAYAQFCDEYSDGLTISVFVQDMTTDKIIWSESSSSYDEKKIKTSNQKFGLWKSLIDKTEKALAKYNIKQEKTIDYRKGSWHRINGQAYKFALTTKGKFQIDCRAEGLGQKMVYKKDVDEHYFDYPFLAAKVEGIIKSPYEDRVIVVFSLEESGFEFIDDLMFQLVGCHLKTGFK